MHEMVRIADIVLENSMCAAAPGEIDNSYAEPLNEWLQTFPTKQMHAIQFEELLEAPEKVMFDLKYFLGANVAELDGEFSKRHLKVVKTPIRRGQYLRLMRSIQEDAEQSLSLLHRYDLAPKKSWLSRWETRWQRVLSDCNSVSECWIETEMEVF